MKRIAVVEGDGIGKEIMPCAMSVLETMNVKVDTVPVDVGYEAWKKHGEAITDKDIDVLEGCDAILKGPIYTPPKKDYSSVTVTIRRALELYANVRPCFSFPGVEVPFTNLDMVFVRENTEGLYSGIEFQVTDDVVCALRVITRKGSERVLKFAFDYAQSHGRKKVTIVHKANILKKSCGLFLDIGMELAKDYDLEVDEMHIDACAMRLAKTPEIFDVIVTTNLFGDILSDLGLGLIGSLGLGYGANMGEDNGMFEPVHGSAPRMVGENRANPTSILLALMSLLEYIGEKEKSDRLLSVMFDLYREKKVLPKDVGGSATASEFAEELISKL